VLAPVHPNILKLGAVAGFMGNEAVAPRVHFIEILPVFYPNLLSGFNLSGSTIQLLRDRYTAACFSFSSRLPGLSAGLVISLLSFPALMPYKINRAGELRTGN
jgi:hypothetical protein